MTLDLGGLFGAGLLTFLSPCVLPLVPLYLSFLSGASIAELKAGRDGRRLWVLGLSFALGLSLVFVLLGMAASVAGAFLSEYRDALIPVAGAFVLLFGLKLLGLVQVPLLDREVRPGMAKAQRGAGVLGAFGLGAAFALGWTPCVGPVLGSALAFAASATNSPAMSALYLAAYAAGLSLPLVAIAAAGPAAIKLVDRMKRHVAKFERATGAVLVAVALLMLTGKLADTMSFDAQPALVQAPAAPEVKAQQAVAVKDPAVKQSLFELAQADAAAPAGEACASDPGATSCDLPAAASQEDLLPVSVPTAPGTRMVQFVSHTCHVCERMKPVVAELAQKCGLDTAVAHVDVGTPSGRAEARARRVVGVPTFVFLGHDGKERARLIGEQPLEELQSALAATGVAACGT